MGLTADHAMVSFGRDGKSTRSGQRYVTEALNTLRSAGWCSYRRGYKGKTYHANTTVLIRPKAPLLSVEDRYIDAIRQGRYLIDLELNRDSVRLSVLTAALAVTLGQGRARGSTTYGNLGELLHVSERTARTWFGKADRLRVYPQAGMGVDISLFRPPMFSREALTAAIRAMTESEKRELARTWPWYVPTLRQADSHTAEELEDITAAVLRVQGREMAA
jgi:hypothetical protein